MVAVAVPATIDPVAGFAFTVIVNTWFVPTLLVAFCGVIWMNASTQFLTAFPQLTAQPAVTFAAVPVVRVNDPTTPTCEIAEDACTFVVPFTVEVIVTVQLDDPTAAG